MSSMLPAVQVEKDVKLWSGFLVKELPAPDTPEYEELIYFDLEAIRNAGLATFQYMPEHIWYLTSSVEVVTDLLTTMRYGNTVDRPVSYTRTGYVPGLPRDPLTYPGHVLDDCSGGLNKLREHKEKFLKDVPESLQKRFHEFERAVEQMVAECRMS